jgi:8-oxo-dGTP pyrophosphatase MutT (NUDIX family)
MQNSVFFRGKLRRGETIASYVDQWPKDSLIKDKFSLVLLKKQSFLGPTYYLEYRKKDPVYGNHFGLFGGTRIKDEMPRATAVREVFEETGLVISETKLRKLALIEGESNVLKEAEGFVYVYEFAGNFKTLSKKRIQDHQETYKRSGAATAEDVGPPILVWRIFGHWFGLINWSKLSPQAAFALIADRDADRKV